MKKIILALFIGFCSLTSFAWNDLDHDVIVLDDSYINNNAILKEKAVSFYGKDYIVYISDVKLSATWFTAKIIIKPGKGNNGDDLELIDNVVQYCDIEDQTPDGNGNTSSCDIALFQNYDFMIISWVHLQQPDTFGNVTVSYTILDTYKNNMFTLDLVFPYESRTITAIDEMSIDNNSTVEYYDLQGRKLNGPQPGIVIEKQGNKVTKKMYR